MPETVRRVPLLHGLLRTAIGLTRVSLVAFGTARSEGASTLQQALQRVSPTDPCGRT